MEAATTDIIPPRSDEHVLCATAMPQEHASDTHATVGWAQLQLLWIARYMVWRGELSIQQLLDKTASTLADDDNDEERKVTEPLSKRLEKAFAMRARWIASATRCTTNDTRRRVLGFHSRSHTQSWLLVFFLRTILGARLWFQRKPPSLPFRPQQASLDSYWLTDRRERLSCGSSPRGQPRNGS